MLRLARLSWQFRDDDNLLIARLESQFLRACSRGNPVEVAQRVNADAEVGMSGPVIVRPFPIAPTRRWSFPLPSRAPRHHRCGLPANARQLVGQPAAHGGVRPRADDPRSARPGRLSRGRSTRLRRDPTHDDPSRPVGGSGRRTPRRCTIHGAIIARELGIPCVNGVADLPVDLLRDGHYVTVDGYLGIVTLGTPEFSLELGTTENEPSRAR